jgi:F-type H+-transporting ATPase subunit delta
MELLVDKRREEALLKTEFEYVLLANEARGIINADIRTAVRMSDDQVNAITAKLESLTGKKIHLIKTIDPKLIGGVEVRIGDEVIDGSIRGQLAELRKRFAQE